MVEGRDRPGFLLEAAQPVGVGAHLGRQHLDGHVPPEPRVPRPVDLAHPSEPDQVEDLVRPETRAGREGHGLAPWSPIRMILPAAAASMSRLA